jgi:hypothetical protein
MANDLTTISAPSLTTSARALLADNDGWVNGVPTKWREPWHLTPMQVQAAARARSALAESLRPATRDQLDAQLMRLAMHGANGPGKDARAMLLAEYRGFLAEMPADIVKAGTDQHIATSPYWPKVSDLMALMEPLMRERKSMLARAERLAAGVNREPERRKLTPEERTRMADGFKSARDVLRNMPGPVA